MSPPQERPPGRTEGRKSWAGGLSGNTDHTGVAHIAADQLTLEDARDRRDHGMQTATHATDIAWRQACDRVIKDLAATGDPFDAETVRRLCGPPVAASPNALGARFGAAAKAGTIVPVGYRQATRAEAHGRVLRVWVGAS